MHLSSFAPLLFLSLFSLVAVEMAVPGCRGDRDKDDRPRQNCTSAGFSHVPAEIELTTKVLLFPLNHFSDLSWSSFAIFKQIHEIDLSQNQISALPLSHSSPLPSLCVLHLGSNQLRSLPDHSFSGSPALTKLFLQNNLISLVSDHSFSGLDKLETLDLSNNLLQTLPALMMFPLTSIKTLYLEANKIAVMPEGWFRQKEEVHYLYLSANPWACSCSLSYLYTYLETYSYNLYVRDGDDISPDDQSVICDSPESLKGQPVVNLEESDLCNGQTTPFQETTTPASTISPFTPASIITTTDTITTATAPAIKTSTAATTRDDRYVTHSYSRIVTRFEIGTSSAEWSDLWNSIRGDGRMVKKTTVIPKTEPPSTTLTTLPTSTLQALTNSPSIFTSDATESTTTTISTFEPVKTTATKANSDVSMKNTSNVPQYFKKSHTFSTSDMTKSQPATISTPERIKTTSTATIFKEMSSKTVSMARSVFCFWMFVTCMFICVILFISSLITALRLYFWYHGIYKSLRCFILGKAQVQMVTLSSNFEQAPARYRTMLFVAKDAKDAECFVDLGAKDRILEAKNVEKTVYKQTVYHVISKEEEIEAKEVLAECSASIEAKDANKKRYSVILREVSEKEGEMQRCDWVVGGWEAETGAGHIWGAWLGDFLPSMPWGVNAPSKSEAVSEEPDLTKTEEIEA